MLDQYEVAYYMAGVVAVAEWDSWADPYEVDYDSELYSDE